MVDLIVVVLVGSIREIKAKLGAIPRLFLQNHTIASFENCLFALHSTLTARIIRTAIQGASKFLSGQFGKETSKDIERFGS
jgi:hypothetical protein